MLRFCFVYILKLKVILDFPSIFIMYDIVFTSENIQKLLVNSFLNNEYILMYTLHQQNIIRVTTRFLHLFRWYNNYLLVHNMNVRQTGMLAFYRMIMEHTLSDDFQNKDLQKHFFWIIFSPRYYSFDVLFVLSFYVLFYITTFVGNLLCCV